MSTYIASIPQLEPVEESSVRHVRHLTRASAIQQGQAVSLEDSRQAEREFEDRRRARKQHLDVTAEEVEKAKRRKTAIDFIGAKEEYGAVMGAPVTRAELEASENRVIAAMTAAMTAALAAESARRYNSTAMSSADMDSFRLRPLPKTTTQVGENSPIGTICPADLFPRSMGDLKSLTEQNLSNLASWYGQDFGIQDDDELQTKRDKFLNFVVWG
mmetsp:Transcript_4241/g.8634  ORF Transcript_4241/g.8634 Transcript_4241/m.8634 type:complete len:215 (+) Transcript_4241:65-709(+)